MKSLYLTREDFGAQLRQAIARRRTGKRFYLEVRQDGYVLVTAKSIDTIEGFVAEGGIEAVEAVVEVMGGDVVDAIDILQRNGRFIIHLGP